MSYDNRRLSEAPSAEHQNLAKGLIQYLNANGWQVTHASGIQGYQAPYQVGDYIPDVIAKAQNGLLAFGEAETCESVTSEHTAAQVDVFSNRIMSNGGATIPFFIVVPESCFGRLKQLIRERFPTRRNITPLHQS